MGDDCLVFVAVDTRVEQRHLTFKASWSMIFSDLKHVLWMLYFSIPWYRLSQQIAGIRHNPLHYWKWIFFNHGWRKIWFLLFCRTMEWPSGNDGFHHWPRNWASDWPKHPASDWTWVSTWRIPMFGHQITVLAITDSFSLDLSSQHLGWEPIRLVTIFGHRFRPWTTTSRRFLW